MKTLAEVIDRLEAIQDTHDAIERIVGWPKCHLPVFAFDEATQSERESLLGQFNHMTRFGHIGHVEHKGRLVKEIAPDGGYHNAYRLQFTPLVASASVVPVAKEAS